jgi:hypothetical protein
MIEKCENTGHGAGPRVDDDQCLISYNPSTVPGDQIGAEAERRELAGPFHGNPTVRGVMYGCTVVVPLRSELLENSICDLIVLIEAQYDSAFGHFTWSFFRLPSMVSIPRLY